jgi:hypothetical protein
MKYSEYMKIRGKIKTADCFFTAGRSIFSRLIRLFTRSQVSHTGIFVWEEDRLYIVESIEGVGVRRELASEYCQHIVSIGRVSEKIDYNEVRCNAFDSIGERYDTIGALLSLFYDTKSSKVFCSEFVARILNLDYRMVKRGITPLDIANKCDFFLYPKK